jgi:hypothetical protein
MTYFIRKLVFKRLAQENSAFFYENVYNLYTEIISRYKHYLRDILSKIVLFTSRCLYDNKEGKSFQTYF